MNKIKRFMLCFNFIFTIMVGIILAQISNQLYRYNRIGVFTEPNESINNFIIELQDKITFIWILWGFLILIAIIHLILEFRRVKAL